MRIEVRNRCSDFDSYRAARVKSLFNAENGCNFDLTADLPIDDDEWKIGIIVGPSGSGKTSMGRKIFSADAFYEPNGWPHDKPIIDAIAPNGDFNAVTAALAAVGLGSVPSWLRPYTVLSNGEKFRADLARIVSEAPERIVFDEFGHRVPSIVIAAPQGQRRGPLGHSHGREGNGRQYLLAVGYGGRRRYRGAGLVLYPSGGECR